MCRTKSVKHRVKSGIVEITSLHVFKVCHGVATLQKSKTAKLLAAAKSKKRRNRSKRSRQSRTGDER